MAMDIERKYEAEKKAAEISLLNKEMTIQTLELEGKNQMIFFMLILVVFLGGGGMVLLRFNFLRRQAFQEVKLKNEELAMQNEEIASQRDQIEDQRQELETKNEVIMESIRYARQIQEAILPSYATVLNSFNEFFVFYKPRDIVSGDFYWVSEKEKLVIAVADCTGHGIPGAFMSMIGNELLNEIVIDREIFDPSTILLELDKGIVRALKQDITENLHGMDISVCVVDKTSQTLEFAGAKNPLVFIQNNEINVVKGDRFGLGGLLQRDKTFTTHSMPYSEENIFYMMSDGLQDQFGGEKDRKYSFNRLKDFIRENHHKKLSEQRELMEGEYLKWKGEREQVDDILVIGFRI
jgi:serine phosphatase RsbU (regulator of sigma subunit)